MLDVRGNGIRRQTVPVRVLQEAGGTFYWDIGGGFNKGTNSRVGISVRDGEAVWARTNSSCTRT